MDVFITAYGEGRAARRFVADIRWMAHPTGFEPVTFAFGGNMASSAKKRKEPPMPAYLPENAKQFEFLLRRSYSSPRHSFRPRAYVVLTREETVGSEEAHA